MAKKPNTLLAQYEARAKAIARAEYDAKLDIHAEIDLMAHLLSIHEDLGVGPGRAEKSLNGFLESKMDIAQAIVDETTDDSQGEFCKTQRDLAKSLQGILGSEAWERCKYLFPTLRDYWDIV